VIFLQKGRLRMYECLPCATHETFPAASIIYPVSLNPMTAGRFTHNG